MAEPDLLLAEYKRRDFLKLLGSGGLLTLPITAAERPVRVRQALDGLFDVFTGKIEMGQGARTLLTQAIAEELRVPVDRIRLTMADTDQVPDDGGTWASLTTPETVPAVRKDVAAFAGHPLTEPKDWKVLGQSIPPLHGPAAVTGALQYCGDLRTEGMLHGCVVRPDAYRAHLESYDDRAARALPGVRIVREGDFLGVVAPDRHTALEAARLVQAQWKPDPLPSLAEMRESFRTKSVAPVEVRDTRYPPLIRQGDTDAALAGAHRKLHSSYWLPPIAHVALEPRAAIAEWHDGALTVHCGKQAPFLVRAELAKAFGLPESKVRIVVTMPGGGFGGKQRGECELEAARLAKAAQAPVRLAWTREEEFWVAYSRPAALVEIESGVDAGGHLSAWRFRNYNAGAPGIKPPYAIAAMSNEFWRSETPLRQGSYRALAATANNFARESHVDEWAHALGKDPLEYRLANIEDARLKEALEKGAALFGWGRRKPGNGRGFGLACNLEKLARLALFVETEGSARNLRIVRIVAMGDFGAALNPDNLKNQMQGALIQGVGGALWEQLLFDNRRQLTKRLSQYRVPRFQDVPDLRVEIIDRREIPAAGAGESSITLPAPALANALYTATGVRPYALPLIS
ncbi:molybdopterin cofactor-binding domain-containing protein [uncultured Paludibaculum sp.]|uniref:xanthine dehydrogenase family protein molybdopterin-binding subunit n=1 Tax=uncultured Paludibaculum sp. TaxID=1765020 RepID=UPI002AAB81F8|nr:molybdopterin cofactor-binding domain-containing protein [uncultured Paludibaculum sp.]